MNDASRIRAEQRDADEISRKPRGNRLTQQPMSARNLGRDYRPLPGAPPITSIRRPAKPAAVKPAWQCCPDCGSDDLAQCRFADHPRIPDVDFKRCNACGNEFDHC